MAILLNGWSVESAEWHGKIRKGYRYGCKKHVFVFYVDSADCHFLFINERYSNKNIIIILI